ncbi:MAG TPA: endo alpha-1,4 polygalactosaminidase [Polyangiaceae bacterium]
MNGLLDARSSPTLRSSCCRYALALGLGASCVRCSYDIVFSPPITESNAGAGGAGPIEGSAGSSTLAPGAAGAPPRATLPPGLSWQWQVTGQLDTSLSVDVFVVDLTETTSDELATLRSKKRLIVCDFSAGTSETWRTDVVALPPEVLGNVVTGHSDELWLDIRSTSVRSFMTKRLELALTRGCDAVLPDSIDGYGADTGFSITKGDSIDYLSFLSREAHARSLAIGLANAPELVATAEPWFDFEVEVSCLEYDECDRYRPFLAANKSVLHAELVDAAATSVQELDAICGDPRRAEFATIVKTPQLGAWRQGCE